MKKTNIQKLLTTNFISLIIAVLGITTLIFSLLQYNSYEENAKKNLDYTCESIGENINLKFKQLDTIILNSINSNDLTSSLEKYSDKSIGMYNHTLVQKHISGVLTSLKGFEYTIRQLNAYTLDNIGYGVGNYIGQLKDYEDSDWYKNTLKLRGRKYVPMVTDVDDYLSISRAYYNSYHKPCGIIEGKILYKDAFKSAMTLQSPYNPKIYAYNSDGMLIYPIMDSSDLFPYYDYKDKSKNTIYNTKLRQNEYITVKDNTYSGISVILVVPTRNFIEPILSSSLGIIMIFIMILSASILLAKTMAKKLSNPIRNIYLFLSNNDKEKNKRLDINATGILEIDQLIDSINKYISDYEEQTSNLITLKEQEIQAQMLALQSQMNPHFLYNSLASISEMAREGLTDSVTTMTVNISKILRHISSNREQVTTIEEELELCDMYLECMSLRFGNNLEYRFDVDDEMLEYMIPKLCIQLLVENSIKSVTTIAPPWKIRIHGYIENDIWNIVVEDNGPGFDPKVDKELRKKMDNILETKTLPSLKIEGMGVLNIFIRFYLLDGITFIFDFGNKADGGAFVKVARRICDSNEKN